MYQFDYVIVEDAFDSEVLGLVEDFDKESCYQDKSLKERIQSLKGVFDAFGALAIRQMNEARVKPRRIPAVIDRISFMADLISDPYQPNAPVLVRNGLLSQEGKILTNVWSEVTQHRDRTLEALDEAIIGLIKIESVLYDRINNMSQGYGASDSEEMSVISVPSFISHPLRRHPSERPFRLTGAQVYQHPRTNFVAR